MTEALLLSQLQFTWMIAWHILLPAFTVGLASFIAFMEALYLSSLDQHQIIGHHNG